MSADDLLATFMSMKTVDPSALVSQFMQVRLTPRKGAALISLSSTFFLYDIFFVYLGNIYIITLVSPQVVSDWHTRVGAPHQRLFIVAYNTHALYQSRADTALIVATFIIIN